MNDIMILLHELVVDLHGFNETHFAIFDDDDRDQLMQLWTTRACKDSRVFVSMLSPQQRRQITLWAISRTRYSLVDIIAAIEKFLKYLKTLSGGGGPLATFSKRKRADAVYPPFDPPTAARRLNGGDGASMLGVSSSAGWKKGKK